MKRIHYMVSDSTLQPIFKELPPVKAVVPKNIRKLPEKAIKILFRIPTLYLCEAVFLHIHQPKRYCNRLNTETKNSVILY